MLTLSSCFYIMKSKFGASKYIDWMDNFISICNEFKLVIYTNEESARHINTRKNPNIKIVIKPFDQFYCYKFRDSWIKNHAKNSMLNGQSRFNTDWELNMLWSEKIAFVRETATQKYFDTEYYGWCDIGYFRNRHNDMPIRDLMAWPNPLKISALDKNKVHYACVNNSKEYVNSLARLINVRSCADLPVQQIPPHQYSVAGGFFLLHQTKIDWWFSLYYSRLEAYFNNNYLVKDDQIIIADCVFSNMGHFKLHYEVAPYDNWFMFQRLLL